jgi:hypothetical protein
MDTKDIINRLSVLGAKYHAVQNDLSNKYHFDQLRDVRINVFRHCAIVIDSTYIIFLVPQQHLFEETWWSSLMHSNLVSRQMNMEQQGIFIYAFDTFVQSSYIIMLFVSVESAFRSFYSSVFSKEVPFKFYKVCKELLHEFNLDQYIDLLKLFSLIRNSYHNSGVHTLDDVEVFWRDKTYLFKQGQQVELGDVWQTLTIITEDILEMLEKLVKQDTILQKKEIIDISQGSLLVRCNFIFRAGYLC